MKIQIIITIILNLAMPYISAQGLSCEQLAQEMQADSTKYLNEIFYPNLSSEEWNCVGKYFAQQDISKGIYRINEFDNSFWANPCVVCRYYSYGFNLYYRFDHVLVSSTLLEGYNEISKAFLKSKIGDSAFAHLEDIQKDYFNPQKFIAYNLKAVKYDSAKLETSHSLVLLGRSSDKYFTKEKINDTTINVKFMVDSLFKDFPDIMQKIVYHFTSHNSNLREEEQTQILNYDQIHQTVFRLTKDKRKGKYYLDIVFDFTNAAGAQKFCWCKKLEQEKYSATIVFDFSQ